MGNLLNIFQSYGASLATCHLKQVNAPHRNPSHTGLYSIYLPQMDRRLSSTSCWLYTEIVYLSAKRHPSKNSPFHSVPIDSRINDLAIAS